MLNVCFCIKNKISKFHFDWNRLFFLSVAQILFIYHGALSIFQYCSIHTLINHTKSKIQKNDDDDNSSKSRSCRGSSFDRLFCKRVTTYCVWGCACVFCTMHVSLCLCSVLVSVFMRVWNWLFQAAEEQQQQKFCFVVLFFLNSFYEREWMSVCSTYL